MKNKFGNDCHFVSLVYKGDTRDSLCVKVPLGVKISAL